MKRLPIAYHDSDGRSVFHQYWEHYCNDHICVVDEMKYILAFLRFS